MRRVLKALDRAAKNFDSEPVHALRVALRQCRSLADVLYEIEPDPCWTSLKKAVKKLFRRLGELRDSQVAATWIRTLSKKGPPDPLAAELLEDLEKSEGKLKPAARKAGASFDRSAWKHWMRRFAHRSPQTFPSVEAFGYLALVRWKEAYTLHRKAVQGAPPETWHELRIALKRFRYVVESFLPDCFEKWSGDLKRCQDLLGEIHDLDMLLGIVCERAEKHPRHSAAWKRRIARARADRVSEYLERTRLRPSLWRSWRRELPRGDGLRDAALAKLEAWARFVDPRFERARRLRSAALQVMEALPPDERPLNASDSRSRSLLEAAALLQGVGRARTDEAVEKASWKMIRAIEPPLGWTPGDIQALAWAVREEPRAAAGREVRTSGLPEAVGNDVRRTAVLLGLARALSRNAKEPLARVTVTRAGDVLLFDAYGPSDSEVVASAAAPRGLLS